jgi:hypothetical protein
MKVKKACCSKYKSKEKQADDNSSHSSQDFLLPSHPHNLSIDQLSTGTSKFPPKIKDFPALCVLMFSEPATVDVPMMSSLLQKLQMLLKPQAC